MGTFYFIFTSVFVSLILRKEQTTRGLNEKNAACWDKSVRLKPLPRVVSGFVHERCSAKGRTFHAKAGLHFILPLFLLEDQSDPLLQR